MPATLTREDFIGLAEIANANRMVTVNMFSGTRLKFSLSAGAKEGKNLLSTGNTIRSSAQKLVKGSKQAFSIPAFKEAGQQFIQQCAGIDNASELLHVVTGDVMRQLVSESLPVLGVAVSAAKLVQAGKVVAQDGYNLYKSRDYRSGFRATDPVAAAEAVTLLIKRDLAVHSIKLGQQATTTGVKVAGLFGDLGTGTNAAVSLANAVASLGLQLYALGQEISDMRAGNKRLARPDDLDLTVFSDCPILGCYLLTCADTSQVANFFIADIGTPNWMDRVEAMKKTKMDPLIKIAKKAINDSRLQLEGLRSDKGTHMEKGFFARIKSKLVNFLNPFAKKPPPPPKVDKSRIVGFGSGS
jgi:hypothetical protein